LNKERNLKLLSFVAPYLQKLKINPEQIEREPAILVKGFDDILDYVNSFSYSREKAGILTAERIVSQSFDANARFDSRKIKLHFAPLSLSGLESWMFEPYDYGVKIENQMLRERWKTYFNLIIP
jgi:hypothetical protein